MTVQQTTTSVQRLRRNRRTTTSKQQASTYSAIEVLHLLYASRLTYLLTYFIQCCKPVEGR